MSVLQAVEQKLRQLKLGRMQAVVEGAIAQAEQHQLGYGEFLDQLLAEELLGRHEKSDSAAAGSGALSVSSNTGAV